MPSNPDAGRWRLAPRWEADVDLCQGDRVNFGGGVWEVLCDHRADVIPPGAPDLYRKI
ncbi:hypothetical protein [Corynebacterium lujinxingii]|uniref:Uncharacterized protein n=1 Tax=Corynebacterium lujinxingii TaxID=2763010 RepID=A0A7H0JWL1_9CORY|nr:hypothetical protein [Corynebacterium lujinxingii]MBC3178932.1 hypothetical protein [Corynebacterium lujinxingii]QNP89427.1 hypothetical protein IAU68_06875 [Corynebacterium lujinxingii]